MTPRALKVPEGGLVVADTITTPIAVRNVEPLAVRPKAAARLLGMSERSFWSLVKGNAIPCCRVGKMRLFRLEALRQWLAEIEATQTGRTDCGDGTK
jgi:excisionase family DNA binding protein